MISPGEAAPPPPESECGLIVDLTGKISTKDCYAKNVDDRFPLSNLFIGDSRLGCKSDADEQLILHISFQEFVKIKSIKFTQFNQGLDPELNPTKVHVYLNREVGFEDWQDIDPTQTLDLTDDDLSEGGEPTLLKYVKFQRVQSLTMFVEDNGGGEITALGSLKFYGRPVQTVNMNDFKANKG